MKFKKMFALLGTMFVLIPATAIAAEEYMAVTLPKLDNFFKSNM